MKGSKRERRPGVWELRVHVGTDPLTHRPRYLSRTVHGGPRSANLELAKLVAKADASDGANARTTVSILLDRWMEHLQTLGRSPTTLRGYRSKIETSIRPVLGEARLDALKPEHLDRFYATQVANGAAAQSVIAMHRIVHAAFVQGVRWGWIDRNPAARATPPSAPTRETRVPNPDELRVVLDRSRSGRHPDRADLLIFLALTGMRRGEVCGLRWSDVDLEVGSLVVRRAVLDVGKLVERQPKTGRVRRMSLGDLGVEILSARLRLFEKRAADAGARLDRDSYVWSDAEDGLEPIRPGTVTQYFSRLVVQCGFSEKVGRRMVPRFSLHSLRHFAAMQMIGANTDVRTVSSRTEHADATTLLRIYARAIETRDREAANVLGRIINGPHSVPT